MKLTVLGTCGAFAEKNRACSGYLIEVGGTAIVLDFGPGTLSNLQNHIDINDIDALIFSHMHPDHFTDVYSLRYLMEFSVMPKQPLPLWGTPGFETIILRLLPEAEQTFRELFSFNYIEGDFAIGGIEIKTARGVHPVENAMLRFDSGRKVLTYTGDTGYNGEIASLAKKSSILLSECTFLAEGPDPQTHLRSSDAGKIAQDAGVGSLLLTHFWPGIDRLQAKQEAAGEFGGIISVASENNSYFI